MPDVQPSRTLAIILGASNYPNAPKVAGGRAFYNSAYEVKEYLQDENSLGLPYENVRWLFDYSHSASDQLMEIRNFLQRRRQDLKSNNCDPENVLIYYVGHGLFSRGDDAFCLAVQGTTESNEGMTSIRGIDLATVIKDNAGSLRRYLIFDCCFAASIYKEFQSGPLMAVKRQIEKEFPEHGTALLCSSSSHDVSKAPPGLSHTMFSSGLMQALRDGNRAGGPRLSFSELGYQVRENICRAYPDTRSRPEVHSPDQRVGDIAQIPLFPNPAYRKPQSVKERAKPAQAERRPAETEREKEKSARELKERKRTEPPEAAEKNRVAAEQAAVQNRLAAQEAAADRILEQRKRRLAEVAEKKRIAAERAAKERAREEAEQKRIATEELANLKAAKKRIAAERAVEVRTAKAAPAYEPDETPTAQPGITGAGIITALILVAVVNLLGFYWGHLLTIMVNGGRGAFVETSGLCLVLCAIPGALLRPIARIGALGKGFRYVAFALWPGFLIGFRFVNDLSSDNQPSVWCALLGIAGFLLGALAEKR